MNISPTAVEPSSLTFLQGPHAKGNSAGYVRASFDTLLGHVLKTKEKGLATVLNVPVSLG